MRSLCSARPIVTPAPKGFALPGTFFTRNTTGFSGEGACSGGFTTQLASARFPSQTTTGVSSAD